jgi:hypothetical protein
MLSVIFSSGEEIKMDQKTKMRGNREIFKSLSTSILIESTGNILIHENGKQVDNIKYIIYASEDDSPKWHQLNLPNNPYVLQINTIYNNTDNIFLVKKIAIQKLTGKQNILLNI